MTVEVFVGDWEHSCCGPEIQRYQRVQWTCVTDSDGRLHETHHDLEGLDVSEVSGTVVDLEVIHADGSRATITRIPSGRALTGNDPDDDGEVLEMYTDIVLDASGEKFVVTLET